MWINVSFDPKFVDAGRSLSLGGYSRRAGLAWFGNEGSWPRVVYNEKVRVRVRVNPFTIAKAYTKKLTL